MIKIPIIEIDLASVVAVGAVAFIGYNVFTGKTPLATSPSSAVTQQIPVDDAALSRRIFEAMERKGYAVNRTAGQVNIVAVSGLNPDGSKNDNRPNAFNDLLLAIDGSGKVLYKERATTEPGSRIVDSPINPKGTAQLAFGQWVDAWQVGAHRNHEALVQTGGPVTVNRDVDKSYSRTSADVADIGFFGINIHTISAGHDQPLDNVGGNSAGCIVTPFPARHRELMRIVKQDPRFIANNRAKFTATLLSNADL